MPKKKKKALVVDKFKVVLRLYLKMDVLASFRIIERKLSMLKSIYLHMLHIIKVFILSRVLM